MGHKHAPTTDWGTPTNFDRSAFAKWDAVLEALNRPLDFIFVVEGFVIVEALP
jgi:hypothetical protein